MWTLGIDASRANEARRTGLPLYNLRVIQELRSLVPPEVRVVLYSPAPLRPELADLPPSWCSRVLWWPRHQLWNQFCMGLEMLRRPPDALLLLHHLLPAVRPARTVALIADLGFEREEGLYGTEADVTSTWPRLAGACMRRLTGGRYGLGEQDYHRWATRQAVRRAARLVAISEFTRSEVIEVYGVPAERLDVARPGVDWERFARAVPKEQAADVLRRHGIRTPYALYVGRLERKKNVRHLIEAFVRLKNDRGLPHQLVLGGSPGSGYAEIRQAIQGSGLPAGDILETGWIGDEDLVPVLQHASTFVFVSTYEGFGIPVLEAQAAGVPVVCSDLPVLREAAGTAAVFCDQHDAAAIAKAMESALTDVALRRRLVDQGQQRCRGFTWPACATDVWQCLLRACTPPTPDSQRAPGALASASRR